MLWNLYDSLILDLDGVVYVGQEPVPFAVESLVGLGPDVALAAATNNASRPPALVGSHLRQLGLPIADAAVVTSAQAGARLLADLVPRGSEVLVIGGAGVRQAVEEVGLLPLLPTGELEADSELSASAAGVIQGHGTSTCWTHLAAAAFAIGRGVPWVATNPDPSVPLPQGLGPGNGALVQALKVCTGVTPRVAGKPQPGLFQEAIARLGLERPLVVGDRLDTDIEGARAAGLDSLLVLTGVTRESDLAGLPAEQRPTYWANDLRCLLHSAPPSGTR